MRPTIRFINNRHYVCLGPRRVPIAIYLRWLFGMITLTPKQKSFLKECLRRK